MTDHIEQANLQWKNKCFIISSCGQNTHCVLPCQFLLIRLSLVRMTPRRRYHANILFLSGIFIFHIFLLLSTGTSDWINTLYMDSTENCPFPWRFHWNTSYRCDNCTVNNRRSRVLHDWNLGPIKSLLSVTFGGNDSITMAIVSPLWRTIFYRAGYCSWSVAFPSHLSPQNLIFEPSLVEKDPWRRNISS